MTEPWRFKLVTWMPDSMTDWIKGEWPVRIMYAWFGIALGMLLQAWLVQQ